MGYTACFKDSETATTCTVELPITNFRWTRRTAGFTLLRIPGLDATQKIALNLGGTEETMTINSYEVSVAQLQSVLNKLKTLVANDVLAARWWLEIRDESGAVVVQALPGAVTDVSVDAEGGRELIRVTLTFTVGKL